MYGRDLQNFGQDPHPPLFRTGRETGWVIVRMKILGKIRSICNRFISISGLKTNKKPENDIHKSAKCTVKTISNFVSLTF